MEISTLEPLLTAEPVAKAIAMSTATLKKKVSTEPSSIPAFLKLGDKPNSPVRWRKCDVEAWIQKQFTESNPTN